MWLAVKLGCDKPFKSSEETCIADSRGYTSSVSSSTTVLSLESQ